ncbi:hypothetical protein KM043_011434 [Ampulex compressa]|nr:hypothetical protein KM043_011434 [Ampulex compressa]
MPAAGAAVPAVAEGAGQLEDLDEPPEPRVRGGSGRAGLMRPLVVLALPGMYLFYKYSQFWREQRELSRRRVAERELQHLHHKIDTNLQQSIEVWNRGTSSFKVILRSWPNFRQFNRSVVALARDARYVKQGKTVSNRKPAKNHIHGRRILDRIPRILAEVAMPGEPLEAGISSIHLDTPPLL